MTLSLRPMIAFLTLMTGAAIVGSAAPRAEPGSRAAPVLTKVEHFYATAPNAQEMFTFFRDTLGLPEVWPFRSYGDFSSGAVSLGNVAFEFAMWKVGAGEVLPTRFAMVAFEPVGDTEVTLAELARRGVRHSKPEPNIFRDPSTGHDVGWVNTDLTGLLPPNVAFVCDYKSRDLVAAGRRKASEQLTYAQGGPLGVVHLKEIVVGVSDVESARREWRKLLDSPASEIDGAFTFGPGPRIRLTQANSEGIQRIVVQVRSVERAAEWLSSRQLLERDPSGAIAIARKAIGGLHIVLVGT